MAEVKILLDSHVWLWLQVEPGRLGKRALATLENPDTQVFLSVASVWELSIKYALRKLPLPQPPAEYVPRRLREQRVEAIAVSLEHVLQAAALPLLHRDPFDRLLIAQAQLESLTILTANARFRQYKVPLLPL